MSRSKHSRQPAPEPTPPSPRSPRFGFTEFRILGRVVRDPQLRHTAQGVAVRNLTVATNDQRTAVYHDLVVFGTAAEQLAEQARKGRAFGFEGRIRSRTLREGERSYRVVDLVVDEFHLASPPAPGERSVE